MIEFIERIREDLTAIHQTEGLVRCKQEKAWCRQIAANFFNRGITAFASVGYPLSARVDNPCRPTECDLVINVAPREWFWIEAKVIWKDSTSAAHYLAQEAVEDARKLDHLRRPEAAHVGLLMIGLDATKRSQYHLEHDVNGRYVRNAGIASWQGRYYSLTPSGNYRVHLWFWWRPVNIIVAR